MYKSTECIFYKINTFLYIVFLSQRPVRQHTYQDNTQHEINLNK